MRDIKFSDYFTSLMAWGIFSNKTVVQISPEELGELNTFTDLFLSAFNWNVRGSQLELFAVSIINAIEFAVRVRGYNYNNNLTLCFTGIAQSLQWVWQPCEWEQCKMPGSGKRKGGKITTLTPFRGQSEDNYIIAITVGSADSDINTSPLSPLWS